MSPDDVAAYRAYYQDEIDSASLYRALAEAEKQGQISEVYRRLAATEEQHAQFWAARLQAANQPVPPARPSWRARTMAWLARRFGPQFVLPTVVDNEQRDSRKYDTLAVTQGTGMGNEEGSHARVLQTMALSSSPNGLEGGSIAQLEGRHRATGGNALRAAVLGANDGIVSNLSLVMGVAGADMATHTILITGLAGLLAGACAMAMGEWLSVQSARELYEHQIAVEKAELTASPEEEETELALIYQAKGLPQDQAQALARQLIANRATALDTLAREELGVNPEEMGGNPWEAAATSFFLFAAGAIIPVFSFFFLAGTTAIALSIVLSAIALFLMGAGTTLFTGRSVLFSGSRQVLFGLAAAAFTFGLGRLLGVSLGG
ncbi:MAG: VIT1/CCC1 transporter family protein [Anaerolineae bacterium]